jgi:hypothetical protein
MQVAVPENIQALIQPELKFIPLPSAFIHSWGKVLSHKGVLRCLDN